MTALFVIALFGIFLALVYGWALEFVVVHALKLDACYGTHFAITVLLGLALLSGLLGIWSLKWNVSINALAFFCSIALVVLFGMRKFVSVRLVVVREQLRSYNGLSWLILVLISIYAFYLAASANPVGDTGLYHAQAIRWIQAYRVVPGLANLHFRLGFNSNLFLLSALFDVPWPDASHTYQIPGLVIFISMVAYGLNLMEKARKDPAIRLSFVAVVGTIVFLISRNDVLARLSSPETDLPSHMVAWVIFFLMMEKIESDTSASLDMSVLAMVVLSFLAITFKLLSLPLLLMPLTVLWELRNSIRFREMVVVVTIPALVFVPWLARTAVLTGYLLFPFAALDVLRFAWKVPPLYVRTITDLITAWARIPHKAANLVLSMNLGQWLPVWYQSLTPSTLLIIDTVLIGSISLTVYVLVRKRYVAQMRMYGVVYAVGLVGLVFWFIQAPDPRFGYGFLVVFLSLVLYAPVFMSFQETVMLPTHWFVLMAQMTMLVFVVSTLFQLPLDSWGRWLNSHRSYPEATTSFVEIDGQVIYYPKTGNLCWYAAFPCTPVFAPGLSMRGTSLEDGFYIRNK